MENVKKAYTECYNTVFEKFNAEDYSGFFPEFRCLIELFSKLLIHDILGKEAPDLISRTNSINYDRQVREYYITANEEEAEEGDGGFLIDLVRDSYWYKHPDIYTARKTTKEGAISKKGKIKYDIENLYSFLKDAYNQSSGTHHAKKSIEGDIKLQATGKFNGVLMWIDTLKTHKIINTPLAEFFDSLAKSQSENEENKENIASENKKITTHDDELNSFIESTAMKIAETVFKNFVNRSSKTTPSERPEKTKTESPTTTEKSADIQNVGIANKDSANTKRPTTFDEGSATTKESTLIGATNIVTLPKWLDDLIFSELSADYCPKREDFICSGDSEQIKSYLGTYFPRSLAESYCIFTQYFNNHKDEYSNHTGLSVYDFCCGTGGELIGFILAVSEQFPNIRKLEISAMDNDVYALQLLERILKRTSEITRFEIPTPHMNPYSIDDSDDMELLSCTITREFDFVITFKSLCEFVSNQQFGSENPYVRFIDIFSQHLSAGGVICVADITTFNEVTHKWLPKMLDDAAKKCNVDVIEKNTGYNEGYHVSHSKKINDLSKIAWRIFKTKTL